MQFTTVLTVLFAASAMAAPSVFARPRSARGRAVTFENDPGFCLRICAPESLRCPETLYKHKFGECYTCCQNPPSEEPSNPDEFLFNF